METASKAKVHLSPADLRAVDDAVTYLRSEYRERISADQLAIEVGLTKAKLQAGFKFKYRLSVHQYILKVRLEKAKDYLINSNIPLKSIATLTGFTDESHLCNVFRKIEFQSPHAFRLQQAI